MTRTAKEAIVKAKTFWIPLLVFLCVGIPVQAQTHRASVRGIATHDLQTRLAGVQLKLIHEETNEVRMTTSGEQGEFAISSLPPGSYRLELERIGYRRHIRKLTLQVNQELRMDISLEIGTLAEEIVVIAPRSLLRRDSAALGLVIENRQLTGLPLDGRNFMELSLLVPGAVPAAPGSAGSVRGDFTFNVNGAREDANSFLLDGVYNVDPKLNTYGVRPPVDAIQEFEILTSTYDAAFGRYAGAQVNVVLKSGSNQLHGSFYEFFRNGGLDARNYFAPRDEAAPQYKRNQFGASLGGPLSQDRSFFFVSYEGRRVRQGITRVANVPTRLERSGDFSQSQFARPIDPFTGQLFPGGKIPKERLNPIGVNIAALYPEPNRSVSLENFVSSPSLRDRDDHFDVRMDQSLGSRDAPSSHLMVRYSFGDRDLFEPFSGPAFALVPGFGTDIPRRAQNLIVSETHILSPFLVNEARFAYGRVAAGSFHENMGTSINRSVGLPELSGDPRDFGLSFITVSGFSPLGDEFNNPQHGLTNTFQILDHATYTRGKHLLKFGLDFFSIKQNAFRDVQSRGFLTFSDQVPISGNALADLLLGFPLLTGGARLDNPQHLRTESYSFFLHDSYRVHPDLTLSMGIRYEYNSPPVDTQDRANLYEPVTQSLLQVGTGGIPRSGYRDDKNNWAPRLGLAWSVSGTTVLRTGYGVYYDQSALAPGEGLYFNAPFFDFNLFFSLPGFPVTLDNPFPSLFPFPLPDSALALQRNLRTAYIQQWNFGIQQQIGRNRVVEFAYVGSKGTKLLTARDINQPGPSPQPFNPRPMPFFDDINLLESRANSNYNSLQLRLQQRLSSGFSALTSYTWAKSIDTASNFFSSAGDPNFPQDSSRVGAERGRSNFDVRHRLSLNFSYDLPIGREAALWGNRGWLSGFLGGWQTYGIVTLQSGRPFTVALLPEINNSNTGRSILGFGYNDRPDRVRNPKLSPGTPGKWFDTTAFTFPPFGSFGNAGRNILDGPGYQNVNLALLKNVVLKEGWDLQIRAEAFNLLNHTNFDLPDNFMGSPTFGRILSAQSPRRLQFGLKLLF